MFLFKKLARARMKNGALPAPPAPHRPALPRAITIPETPLSRRSHADLIESTDSEPEALDVAAGFRKETA